jgi:hypothetical protein
MAFVYNSECQAKGKEVKSNSANSYKGAVIVMVISESLGYFKDQVKVPGTLPLLWPSFYFFQPIFKKICSTTKKDVVDTKKY